MSGSSAPLLSLTVGHAIVSGGEVAQNVEIRLYMRCSEFFTLACKMSLHTSLPHTRTRIPPTFKWMPTRNHIDAQIVTFKRACCKVSLLTGQWRVGRARSTGLRRRRGRQAAGFARARHRSCGHSQSHRGAAVARMQEQRLERSRTLQHRRRRGPRRSGRSGAIACAARGVGACACVVSSGACHTWSRRR